MEVEGIDVNNMMHLKNEECSFTSQSLIKKDLVENHFQIDE